MITQEYLKEILTYDEETGIFKWNVSRCNVKIGSTAGKTRKDGYVVIGIDKKHYLSHRLAWVYKYGEFPKRFLDHIDGNPSNNKISNLREANDSENAFNTKIRNDNTSGYKGVDFLKSNNKYRARLRINKKEIHLGLFDDLELAQLVVSEARLKYCKNFARDK
jgi:hypothetical protein